MEHVNTINQRQQQQQQQQLQQHHLEQQQQHNENQQQFCLRWHNHQTSLLSTLPVLLDQSHLTDVTISAEGRTLRAHRVVLSACSTFFMEIFRALEATNHPVIIIPGASFAAIVALLTFMYSGEVNVYEEQIPTLLNLAETLGIKGLADVQNNNLSKPMKSANSTPHSIEKLTECERIQSPPTPPSPPPPPTPVALAAVVAPPPLVSPLLANKLSGGGGAGGCGSAAAVTPLENLFLKSLQFYPNLLPQPLNFSQTALNKTTELLAKYQQQCQQLYQDTDNNNIDLDWNNTSNNKRAKVATTSTPHPTMQQQQQQQLHQHQQKDIKRIDKIVESLRVSNNDINSGSSSLAMAASSPMTLTPPLAMQHFSPQLQSSASSVKQCPPTMYSKVAANPTTTGVAHNHHNISSYISPEDHAKLQQHIEQYAAAAAAATTSMSCLSGSSGASTLVSAKSEPNLLALTEKLNAPLTPNPTPAKPPSNSKLYATCFICHKQLSNQYNLRVHLETHQNVRYACNVCSHVSRSKDALRKHVSYRHPGAPSPCENEARRKRITKLASTSPTISTSPPSSLSLASSSASSSSITSTTTLTTLTATPAISGDAAVATTTTNVNNTTPQPTQMPSPYLFLPNQFHLAAAAAAAAAVAETNSTPALDLATATITGGGNEMTSLIKTENGINGGSGGGADGVAPAL